MNSETKFEAMEFETTPDLLASIESHEFKPDFERMTRIFSQAPLGCTERHNLQVELNVAEWNNSYSKKAYAILVVVFLLFA